MLPGLRLVVATILITVSAVVFGIGAIALMRAAHEDASRLPLQPPRDFAQRPAPEASPPTLAVLRPIAANPATETAAPVSTKSSAPVVSEPAVQATTPGGKTAALILKDNDAASNAVEEAARPEVKRSRGRSLRAIRAARARALARRRAMANRPAQQSGPFSPIFNTP